MSLPNLRPSRARSRANETTAAPTEAKAAGRRSVSDLAKMDIGELMSLISLPSLPSRKPREHRAGRSGGRALVGLDVEPGYVTAAQVSVNGALAVERAAGIEIASEVVRDGEVVDVPALADALKKLFAENKLDPRVRLGIANQRIVVRTLELPPIADPSELDTAVRFQAQNDLPMSLDSAVIDYHSLGIAETPSGPRQRVVLVAARREMVERLLMAAREAGLRPEGIDLSAFAMIRSLYLPGTAPDERTVYLSLGGVGNLAVAEGRVCQFTRVLSIGLESITADVAERLGVSTADARSMLMRAGVESPRARAAGRDVQDAYGATADTETLALAGAPATSAGDDGSDLELDDDGEAATSSQDVMETVRTLLAEGIRRIGVEIRNSLHYHSIHGGDQSATRVVVSGAMTQIPGLVAALTAELELDVQLGAVREAHPGALGNVPAERVAVAAGLSVTEVPA